MLSCAMLWLAQFYHPLFAHFFVSNSGKPDFYIHLFILIGWNSVWAWENVVQYIKLLVFLRMKFSMVDVANIIYMDILWIHYKTSISADTATARSFTKIKIKRAATMTGRGKSNRVEVDISEFIGKTRLEFLKINVYGCMSLSSC